MKRTVCGVLMAAILVSVGCGSAAAIDLDIFQIDWLGEAGGYTEQDSDWGMARVTVSSADEPAFFFDNLTDTYFGYANITTQVGDGDMNWAVQNAPLIFGSVPEMDELLPYNYWFDLGVAPGTDVANIKCALTINDFPLLEMPAIEKIEKAVQNFGQLFGGLSGDADDPFDTLPDNEPNPFAGNVAGVNAPPRPQNFMGVNPENPDNMPIKQGRQTKENEIPAVDEEINGCAPASAARSLKHLENTRDVIEDLGDVQDLYDKLKMEMKTSLGARGTGTQIDDFEDGKEDVTDDLKLPIVTEQTDSVHDAIETLQKKGDVEVLIWWGKNGNGDSLGAHAAMITEIIKLMDGSYVLSYVDDSTQGDGKAANDKHTITVGPDGTFKGAGAGAKILGFQTEVVLPIPGAALFFLIGLAGLPFMRRNND